MITNSFKQILSLLRKNAWWICLCLQLLAWILSGLDIFTGIYYVSAHSSLGKGQLAECTLFLWFIWFILLIFVPKVKKFFLMFFCAFGMELKLLMFVRALSEGVNQFHLSELFYDGILGCLLFSFGDSLLKSMFWQSVYIVGMQILENILFIYCLYLLFEGIFAFIKFLRKNAKQEDMPMDYAILVKKFFKLVHKQLFYICLCIQTFFEPVPYLDEKMFLHLYPSGMNETGWIGGIFIFIWLVLLSKFSFAKMLIPIFLCATGFSLFNDYPADRTFQYPKEDIALDIEYFPIQALFNNCGNNLLQYCNEKLSAIFSYFLGNIYEPIHSIIFIFLVLFLIVLGIKILFLIFDYLIMKDKSKPPD